MFCYSIGFDKYSTILCNVSIMVLPTQLHCYKWVKQEHNWNQDTQNISTLDIKKLM